MPRCYRPTHNWCGSICHRNILPFHGFHEDPENFSLVLALAPHGDVTGWIQADERPRAVVAPLVVSSVARALSYLHQHRIAHRDIKPENILVVGPVHFCLGDFGWACMGNLTRSTFCGTPEFLAPEIVVSPCPYDAPSVDLWALGVLMYELVYGSTPFAHKECRDDDETRDVEAHKDEAHDHDNAGGCPHSGNLSIFWKIRSFREPVVAPASPLPAVMDAFTEATVLDFCSQLMKISPAERMKPDEALQHPLLQTASLSYDADATTTTTPPCVSHSGTSNAAVTASPSWSIGSSNSDSYQTPRRSSGVALTYE